MSVIKSAKTVEEAVKLALNELAADISDVDVKVIEKPKSGFLGFGSKDALVEVTLKDEKGKNIEGIIVEPLFHALVHTYYLNSVQKSIAYKHTCIEINNKCTFKEIRYKGKEKYSGINRCHPMNHKAIYSKNLLIMILKLNQLL